MEDSGHTELSTCGTQQRVERGTDGCLTVARAGEFLLGGGSELRHRRAHPRWHTRHISSLTSSGRLSST
jgi:hypothetical protein